MSTDRALVLSGAVTAVCIAGLLTQSLVLAAALAAILFAAQGPSAD